MKRLLALTTLLILTACATATESPMPTLSPSATSTASHTPSPTATESPTSTLYPTPTAAQPPEPIEGETYREIARYALKGEIIRSRLSPDGSMLAVMADDGVYLYDPNTLELRWFHERSFRTETKIVWNSNNELLFIPKEPPYYILDPEDGSILEEVDEKFVFKGTIPSPNGKYFYTYDDSLESPVYDAKTGERLFTLPNLSKVCLPLWMPDGEHLITFPTGGPFEVRNVKHSEIVQELGTPDDYEWEDYYCWRVGTTSDGHYLAYIGHSSVPGKEMRVMAWNLITGESLAIEELEGSPSDHGWKLNEQTITFDDEAVVHINGSVAEVAFLYKSPLIPTRDIYRRTDGLLVVLVDAIVRYDEDFNLVNTVEGHDSGGIISLSPNGQMLAMEAYTRFYVWDIGQNELVTAATEMEAFLNARAGWSPDSKTLAIGDHKRQVRLWDADTRQIEKTIDAGSHICFLAWVDDTTLALGLTEVFIPTGEGGTCMGEILALVDTETGQIIFREDQSVYRLDFISLYDGRHIAFRQWPDLGADTTIETLIIWDSHTKQPIYSAEVDFFSSIRRLQHKPGVVITEEGLLHVIDMETEEEYTIPFKPADSSGWYPFYILDDYILDYDIDNAEISWYDLDGNWLATEKIYFRGHSSQSPVITADGRIFDIVYPGGYEVVLIEFFPPEQ